MIEGPKTFRRAMGRIHYSKGILYGSHTMPSDERFRSLQPEFEKALDVVQASYDFYSSNPVFSKGVEGMFLTPTLLQMKGDATFSASQWLQARFSRMVVEKEVSEETRELYKRWEEKMESTLAIQGEVKLTLLYGRVEVMPGIFTKSNPPQRKEIDDMSLRCEQELASVRREFGYLGSCPSNQDELQVLELSKKMMEASIKEWGADSTTGIKASMNHIDKMMKCTSGDNWKPFEILDSLMQLLDTASLRLGDGHGTTDYISHTLEGFIATRREGTHRLLTKQERDQKGAFAMVLRYNAANDSYIFETGNVQRPADIILQNGALVECVNLKAEHLNGKRCWVVEYDEKSTRHMVKFEDQSLKPCLIKPANLRLLWFEEKYEKRIRKRICDKKREIAKSTDLLKRGL